MSTTDKPRNPRHIEQAESFDKSAFDVHDTGELARAMADWTDLTEAERGFTLAHLLYLNLQAQAHNGRLLRETRDTLEEIADELTEAVDDVLGDEDDDEATTDEPTDQPAAQASPAQA